MSGSAQSQARGPDRDVRLRITSEEFASALGDRETVGIVLRGAIVPLQGPIAVFLEGASDWYYDEPSRFAPLCTFLRSTDKGKTICLDSDRALASSAATSGDVAVSLCRAGLMDLAAPILTDGRCPAVILCGQLRPADAGMCRKATAKLQEIAAEIGVDYDHLHNLWQQSPTCTDRELESAITRLRKVGSFVGGLLRQVVEARVREAELQLAQEENVARLDSQDFLTRTISRISTLQELYDLRKALPSVLRAANTHFGAKASGVLTTARAGAANDYIVQAAATQAGEYFYGARYARLQGTRRIGVQGFLGDTLLARLAGDASPRVLVVPLCQVEPGPFREYLEDTWGAARRDRGCVMLAQAPLGRERIGETSKLVLWMAMDSGSCGESRGSARPTQETARGLAEGLARVYRNSELYTERRDFLEDVTHQVWTPLLNAADTCEYVLESTYWLDQEQVKARMAQARGLLRHCQMWIQAFKTAASHGETESLLPAHELSTSHANVTKLMIEVGADFRSRASGKRVLITVDEGSLDGIGKVCCDEEWVRHAIMNLVDNAVKYSPAFKREKVCLFGVIADREIGLAVSNTSVRIPQKDKQLIFERWYRTPEAEDEEVQGTGLGLAIVKAVAEAHGGRVTVEQGNRGANGYPTTFVLWLPRTDARSRKRGLGHV